MKKLLKLTIFGSCLACLIGILLFFNMGKTVILSVKNHKVYYKDSCNNKELLKETVDALSFVDSLTASKQFTTLCFLMNKYGSDKGNGWHNYTLFYYGLFRGKKFNNVFEVGLGTNNLDVPSNMGVDGKPGASLRGWRDFFKTPNVFGADVDKRVLFKEDGIDTFYVDQLDTPSITSLNKILKHIEFELILDDGLHTFIANKNFFDYFQDRLAKGGYYIIEDVKKEDLEKYIKYFVPLGALVVDLYNEHNNSDNGLVVFKKV